MTSTPDPDEQSALHLIPLHEVMRRVGYRRTTIYSLINTGAFPRPVKAGAGRSCRWVLSEVEAHIAAAIAARDAAQRKKRPRRKSSA